MTQSVLVFGRQRDVGGAASSGAEHDDPERLTELRVFPGHDGTALVYDDDGKTNAYRNADTGKATLVWNDSNQTLTSRTKLPTGQDIAGLVKVVDR